ncbi:MAG: putative addiction module antidote protein [Polaromonas sp.]|nr:putative addiction module antidote protein [Polaromonas sp.]
MHKLELIQAIDAARTSRKLSKKSLAEAVGLNVKSVDNALSPAGNPQLSTLLAIVDAVGLEIELVPKGFGARSGPGLPPVTVASVVDVALGRSQK